MPTSAPATGYTHTTELRVRYAETDQMGVVYHAHYLVWCEMGRTDFIRALGTPYAELERDGLALAVAEATLRCHASARYDELIRVATTLTAVRSRAITFAYRIANAESGTHLVTASTTLVALDGTGRVIALPTVVRDRLVRALG
jgi:acyl-CoA thioester hydrolase